MRKPNQYLSGRVKTKAPSLVDSGRYDYLSLENAEPNLGVPAADNSIAISSTGGVRGWATLGAGLTIANNVISATLDTANLEVTITQNITANTTLQSVTDQGATTNNAITVENSLTASNLILSQNGTLTFEGSSDDAFETILTVENPTADRTITIPNNTGTILTTGVGSLSIAGAPSVSTYDIFVKRAADSAAYVLDPTDLVAGYLIVNESTDDNATYNVMLMQPASPTGGGSTTTGRATMVDNGGLIFNPGTNTLQTQIVVGTTVVASNLIQAATGNTDITIRGSGSGHINLYDVVDTAPEYINMGHNVAVYQTNSDRGIIIGHNDQANVAITALTIGESYTIIEAGDSTWTSVGAPDNTVGTSFVATGQGTGTGVASPDAGVKLSFIGVDHTDNVFKYIPDATVTNNRQYNDMTAVGDVGNAKFKNLVLTGDLQIQGNTTTINSTTISIEDPLIFIGNANNTVDDGLDRGLIFNYYDTGVSPNPGASTGFMGWDNSYDGFVFCKSVDSVSNNVVSYTESTQKFGNVKLGGLNTLGSAHISSNTTGSSILRVGPYNSGGPHVTFEVGSMVSSPGSSSEGVQLQANSTFTKKYDLWLQTKGGAERIILDNTDNSIKLYAANTVVTVDSAGLSVNGTLDVSGLSVNGTLDVSGNVTFEDNIITVGTDADDALDRGIAFPYFNTGANTANQALLAWDDDRNRFILVRDGTITNGLVQSTNLAGMKLSELWFTRTPQTEGFDINDMNLGASGIATGGFPAQGYSTKSFIIIEGGSTATNSNLNYLRIGSSYSSNQSIVVHSGLTANVELSVQDANNFVTMSVGGTDKVTVGASSVTISDNTTINGDLFVDSNSTLYTDVITNYENCLFLLSAAPGTLTMEISGPNETDGTVPTPVIIKGGDGTSNTVVGGDVEISGGNSTTDGVVKIEGQIFPQTVGSNNQVLEVVNSTTGQLGWKTISFSDVLQNISAENNTDAERYITFVDSQTGAQQGKTDTALQYNSAKNNLTAGNFSATDAMYAVNGIQIGGTVLSNMVAAVDIRGSLGQAGQNLYLYMDDGSEGTFYDGITIGPGSDYGDGTVEFSPVSAPASSTTADQWFHIKNEVGTGTTNHHLRVDGDIENGGDITSSGTLTAVAKSFLIDHPTQKGKKLRHGSLEGPENGVYVRGRLKGNNIIELPEYWLGLVDEDTITVELTPIGKHQKLFVKDIADNAILVGNDNLLSKEINCFYTVYGERKDIDKMVVEYDAK